MSLDCRIAVHGHKGKLGSLIVNHAPCAIIPRDAAVERCDVVIDVSSATGLTNLIPRLSGQALLVGTTGDLPWGALEAYAQRAPVAVVPNFSVGVPVLLKLIDTALKMLPEGWDIEVIEAHHNQKKDAPSGTAKRLVRAIEEHGYEQVPAHALRVGDTFGEHSVWMCGPGERIELKHVATKREVFAIGAHRWAKWLQAQENGLIKA